MCGDTGEWGLAGVIYLVRHGQTEWNADGDRFCGSSDIPLSNEGLRQAQQLGRVLSAVPLAAVYHSGMQRSRATAAAIVSEQWTTGKVAIGPDGTDQHTANSIDEGGLVSATGKAHAVLMEDRDFREVDFGAWEGLTKKQVAVRDPLVFAAWESQPGTTAVPGAAPVMDAQRRALVAVRRAARRHGREHVAIVAHSTLNRLLLTGLLDAPIDSYRRIVQSNACVNILDLHGDAVHIYGVNMRTLPIAF